MTGQLQRPSTCAALHCLRLDHEWGNIEDWHMLETSTSVHAPYICCAAGAGSTRDQALYSAKLALISAILYVIAAIAM